MAASLTEESRLCVVLPKPIPARLQCQCNAAGEPERHKRRRKKAKEEVMPLVNVRLIEGVFAPEQKREMVHQLGH
jgi:hypothetical protein